MAISLIKYINITFLQIYNLMDSSSLEAKVIKWKMKENEEEKSILESLVIGRYQF